MMLSLGEFDVSQLPEAGRQTAWRALPDLIIRYNDPAKITRGLVLIAARAARKAGVRPGYGGAHWKKSPSEWRPSDDA